MKKLLIFHPALAPYMVDQFNALNKLFDLEVVFLFENLYYDKFDQCKLLPLLECKYSFLLFGIAHKERVFRFGILSTIRRVNPDIILSYEYSFTTQYLILFKRLGVLKQKIGSIIDDNINICENVQSNLRYIARRISINHLDYFIVLSDLVSKFYQEELCVDEKRLIINPLLQNSNRLRKNRENLERIAGDYDIKFGLKGKKVLLFVGRLVKVKGVDVFIDNVKCILGKQEDVIFVIIGEGVDGSSIQSMIHHNKLQDKVIMPGRFEGDELYAWYLCASGLVLPSTFEPYGAVVNEALIFGNKVLCSLYAGASVLIEKGKGLVFDPTDSKDTIFKFNDFLESIDIHNQSLLEFKPSLMEVHENNFESEWRKMIVE